MASTPVLDLDTLADKPTVRISGKLYRLWSIDTLPPLENHRVRKMLRRIDELSLKDDLTAKEDKELTSLFDDVTRVVIDAPEAVHKKLKPKQQADIIQSFLMPSLHLIQGMLAAANSPTQTAESPTGASSPLGSAGSTQP